MKPHSSSFEEIIRQVAIFRQAGSEEISAIARLAGKMAVNEGSFFFHQGEPASRLFIMVEGRAKICKVSLDGQQINLRTISSNQLFGAIGSVEPEGTYPASAQALENCTALVIESQEFARLIKDYPQLSFGLMQLMTGYIQEMQERYHELATQKVRQRIARVLLRLAAQSGQKLGTGILIDLPFSRQDLAEMAGTTLFTVSRVLAGLEKKGLISTGRERVTIIRPHELVRLAEDLDS